MSFAVTRGRLMGIGALTERCTCLPKKSLALTDGRSEQNILGQLEMSVMEIVWSQGQSRVHDVVASLDRELAYTTVMTTLGRLFRKGLLDRRKVQRAFVYSPRLSRHEWEQQRAGHLVAGFLTGTQPSRELLLSCLLDVVGKHDAELLDELEKKIRLTRKELLRRGQP